MSVLTDLIGEESRYRDRYMRAIGAPPQSRPLLDRILDRPVAAPPPGPAPRPFNPKSQYLALSTPGGALKVVQS